MLITLSRALGPNDLVGRWRLGFEVEATDVVDCAEDGVGRDEDEGMGAGIEDAEAMLVEERGVRDWTPFVESRDGVE